VTAAKAKAVVDLEVAKRLAAKFKALGDGALTKELTQEAEHGNLLRECWLAYERLRVSEVRSINCAEILTARADADAEVTELATAEAAAAEAAAAVGAASAAEAAAKAAADALGARTALALELLKKPGGGADGIAEDAEEISGRPVFSVGAREEMKLEAGRSASSEQTRKSWPRDQQRSKF
jgi:hypothetical protein